MKILKYLIFESFLFSLVDVSACLFCFLWKWLSFVIFFVVWVTTTPQWFFILCFGIGCLNVFILLNFFGYWLECCRSCLIEECSTRVLFECLLLDPFYVFFASSCQWNDHHVEWNALFLFLTTGPGCSHLDDLCNSVVTCDESQMMSILILVQMTIPSESSLHWLHYIPLVSNHGLVEHIGYKLIWIFNWRHL